MGENGKGTKKVGKWGINCFNEIFEVINLPEVLFANHCSDCSMNGVE